MKSSIRKFLLLYLLIVICITITLIALANYYFKQYNLVLAILLLPFLGLLIWFIIDRGLNSLKRITKELANRAPSHLEPVNIKNLPEEVTPVIDELNKLFYRLKEGFEREKRFAADAAHELKTPLAAIKAQAQIALNTTNMQDKDIALQKLLTSVNRSTHIIQQLLIMSKLVPEEQSICELDPVDLPKITREILAILVPHAMKKQIELEFDYEDDVHLTIPGNSTAISILIRNLVDNAIRYSHTGGNITVRVYKTQQEVVLQVQDNGPGIPQKLHSRVFERFYRVLGNKSPGSGLGLAIVHQIAILHNGRVHLSTPANSSGLIVKVFFPL